MPRPDFSHLPASQASRAHYAENLTNQAADLALHANTALPLALATHQSEAAAFFASSAFASYRKTLEAKAKLTQSYFGRLDAIIKGISGLGKLLAKRR